MARPKSADPLIDAMIKKLPPADGEWSVDKQAAWLNLMAMAFGTVYGGDVVGQLASKRNEAATTSTPLPDGLVASMLNVSTLPSRKKPNLHKFYVDGEGYARRNNGDRIMPKDVADVLYDHRGLAGDMATIKWADDSTGIGGLDVTVAAA